MAEVPALDALPYKIWSRLVIQRARRMLVSSLRYQSMAGYQPLREAIAAHITVSHQVHCTPEQVMIMPGSQGALDLAARMLINAGDSVWMEDPGYPGTRNAYVGAGANIIPVPVDNEGLMVNTGIERASSTNGIHHALSSIPIGSDDVPLEAACSTGLGKPR